MNSKFTQYLKNIICISESSDIIKTNFGTSKEFDDFYSINFDLYEKNKDPQIKQKIDDFKLYAKTLSIVDLENYIQYNRLKSQVEESQYKDLQELEELSRNDKTSASDFLSIVLSSPLFSKETIKNIEDILKSQMNFNEKEVIRQYKFYSNKKEEEEERYKKLEEETILLYKELKNEVTKINDPNERKKELQKLELEEKEEIKKIKKRLSIQLQNISIDSKKLEKEQDKMQDYDMKTMAFNLINHSKNISKNSSFREQLLKSIIKDKQQNKDEEDKINALLNQQNQLLKKYSGLYSKEVDLISTPSPMYLNSEKQKKSESVKKIINNWKNLKYEFDQLESKSIANYYDSIKNDNVYKLFYSLFNKYKDESLEIDKQIITNILEKPFSILYDLPEFYKSQITNHTSRKKSQLVQKISKVISQMEKDLSDGSFFTNIQPKATLTKTIMSEPKISVPIYVEESSVKSAVSTIQSISYSDIKAALQSIKNFPPIFKKIKSVIELLIQINSLSDFLKKNKYKNLIKSAIDDLDNKLLESVIDSEKDDQYENISSGIGLDEVKDLLK
jgi:hypothetical protein